jgi:two-component system LytT family response regulator
MDKIIKTIIIDDDPVSTKKLSDDLKVFPDIKVIDTATSAEKAVKITIDKQPDLLFLDIEMPGMSGIDLLKKIQPDINPDMRIVFYSAHDKYMRNAMLVSDFDYYLLKPYLPEELSMAVKRIRLKESRATVEQLLHKLIQDNRFSVQTISGIEIIKREDVLFFEYLKKERNWQICFTVPEPLRMPLQLRATVTSKEILSVSPTFIQINQNCIINLTYLSFIENKSQKCRLNIPLDSPEFKISSRFYRKVKDALEVL